MKKLTQMQNNHNNIIDNYDIIILAQEAILLDQGLETT